MLSLSSSHLRCLHRYLPTLAYSTLPSRSWKEFAGVLHDLTSPRNLSRYAFPSLLRAAASQADLNHGKSIHAAAVTMGFHSDPYIVSSLVSMYVKCGSLFEAASVFDSLPERDATLWNAMISGYFQCGYWQGGLSCFTMMQRSGILPDAYTLSILLGACGDWFGLERGKEIHGYVFRTMLGPDPFLSSTLIDMYCKCGRISTAHEVFGMAPERNVYVWNVMIGGFCNDGYWEEALELFVLMKYQCHKLESATFLNILTACSYGEDVVFGKAVHCDVVKRGFDLDSYVCTSLLAMYAKCRLANDALRVFNGVSKTTRALGLWNTLMTAYIGTGCAKKALNLYVEMRYDAVGADSFTMSNALSACTMANLCDFGRSLHGELIKRPELSTMAVQSSLMTMYAKCGNIEDATAVFDSIEERDAVVWGSMIGGLCQNGRFIEALNLFKEMEVQGMKFDSVIISTVLSACVRLGYTELGYQIHTFSFKSGTDLDVFVSSPLLDMYAKAGLLESAEKVFSSMPHKNLIAWNSMISAYSRNGQLDRSITTFAQISQNGLAPDSVSVVNILVAVSSVAALTKGKIIHAYLVRNEIAVDEHANNTLLDMYIKCGCLRNAEAIFRRMPEQNIATWNSMIGGLGSYGHCFEAISLFEEMQCLGVKPDDITFLALISSCSHSGFVQEGLKLFHCMGKNFKIAPQMEHYASVVDLLGRAGHLNEAHNFIQNMPFEPDSSVWQNLLHASRTCKNLEVGELAAYHLRKLQATETSDDGILLLNLYGESGLVDKAADVRVLLRSKGLKKNPGCSWIELKSMVEVFYSGDSSSSKSVEIHDTLKGLRRNLGEEDFSSWNSWCNIEDMG